MDELDNILTNIDLEEEKQDAKGDYADEWWCMDCEHGPMDEKDNKCDRCGAKNSQYACLLYTSPSPRDATLSRMPSSA